jgi:glycosyltransferase involved in cell wall biosynthesis
MFVLSGLGTGGAERVVSLLSASWAEGGKQVCVVAFDAPGDPLAFPFHPQVELIRLNLPPGKGSLWRGAITSIRRQLALRRLFARQRPDAVISFLTKVNVLALLAALGSGIPVIISERNNPDEQGAHPLWWWSWTRLSRLAAAVVLQTRAIERRYRGVLGANTTVIPNPVEVPGPVRRAAAGRTLVAAGRLSHQKGFDLLIAAFALVAHEFPDWRLVIWGEGAERSALEAQVSRACLGPRVALPGASDGPVGWIEGADAFVLSSRYEGFPNVLVEAMTAGLPVIAFDCDFGPGEILTLRLVMQDEGLRARMGCEAAQTAENFRLRNTVPLWDALLNKILYSAE